MDTVLVVDDDPAIRDIFTTYLAMHGFEALAASGGIECLDILETHTPDLILLDLMMEPMDGWETLLAIRRHTPSRVIPVVIITGKQPDPEEIVKYGGFIEDFVIKPVDFRNVVLCVHRIITRDRDMRREIGRIAHDGRDGELAAEYCRLLRLVRAAHMMKKRYADRQWIDHISFPKQEERMHELHAHLNMPDVLLPEDRDR